MFVRFCYYIYDVKLYFNFSYVCSLDLFFVFNSSSYLVVI